MSAVHVTVRVGSELYALPVETVREVAELGRPTPVPGAATGTLGLLGLHGAALPVFDLASLLGLASAVHAERLVVLETRHGPAGLVVDEVVDVGVLPPAEQEADAPAFTGMVLTDAGLVGVIDLDRLLGGLGDAEAA